MKNRDVFLREPPKNLDFQEMFRFIWLQGVGNIRDKHGEPKPWTDTSLEDRFYELGYEIDKRTIQNWLSGKNKPSAKNLHRLARVVSNDDTGFKRHWRDAFTMTNVMKDRDIPSPKNPTSKLETQTDTETSQRLAPLFAGLAVIALISLIGLVNFLSRPPEIQVTNLKICDEARFDRTAKTCTTNVTHFPAGTSLIFVSFNMPNAPEGQAFVRKWYREGQLFLSKEGFIDSAWEDYTWLKNPNGHDQGKYDLRIIVNGNVTTSSFFVGEINEDHEWP